VTSALLIGAGGLLGASLARELSVAGWRIAPLYRGDALPSGRFDLVLDCNGDARRFWCNRHPAGSFEANVASVMQRLAGLSFGQYVYFSTVDVYGPNRADPAKSTEESPLPTGELDIYAFHKQLAESLVRFHAENWLILRLGTLIGPGLKKNPVFDAIKGDPIRMEPDSTLSLVRSVFVAKALKILVGQGAEGIWNLAGSPITVSAILDTVGRAPTWHEERISLAYAVNVAKISALTDHPSSQAMLEQYLREDCGEACMS
jgi:nucleoside-diphosphate-sugar epimerase